MHGRHGLTVFCLTLLAACQRHDAIPDGTVVIDETVSLARGATSDTASRTLAVNDDSIVVAIVDELPMPTARPSTSSKWITTSPAWSARDVQYVTG